MDNFLVIHVGRASPVAKVRADIRERLRAFPAGAYLDLDCAWLVQSNETADEIRDHLSRVLPSEDGLLVFGLGEQTAWTGQQAEWLVEHV